MSDRRRTTTEVVVYPGGRVVKYKRDRVGNDLTAVLRWCWTHEQPLWVHDDGSFTCPWTWKVTRSTKPYGQHVIGPAPWEDGFPDE
jgi:hypothetical protein